MSKYEISEKAITKFRRAMVNLALVTMGVGFLIGYLIGRFL